ncbi:MAG: serine/threonine protein kinase [Actinobacteria bacterium]|nr:MAG: serine/threonine protein kinase [Actinomycetota bacterium]
MSERLAPGVGQTFGGYTIESLLGRGGMGTVFLATHERLGRKVALKVISPEIAHDEDFRTRFLRESELVASLDDPNVIPIYDADEVDGVLYLAMRYVDGPSLRDRISVQVKPANILLAEPGGHAYLCDFGLAKRTSSRGATRTGSFLGSVDYCAPEQIQGQPVDERTDIYSLGCVLFHCLTGEPPYRRETEFAVLHAHLEDPPPTLSAARADLPRKLDGVVARAMAKTQADRYATAGALAAAFGQALGRPEAEGDVTRPAPAVRALPRERARPPRKWLVAAAVIGAALVIGGAAAALLATRGSSGSASAQDAAVRTFVNRIENVLAQSADGRSEIGKALSAGFKCSISPREAGRRIASVADNRQSILGQIGTLPTPTDETGVDVTRLQGALQQSIEADRHYRDGFYTVPAGSRCPLPGNVGFVLAAKSDAQATAAKRRFVRAFNPLARQFGRKTWSPGGF